MRGDGRSYAPAKGSSSSRRREWFLGELADPECAGQHNRGETRRKDRSTFLCAAICATRRRSRPANPDPPPRPVLHDLAMPAPTTLLLFALATFLLTVTPGPGVLYV